MEIQSLTASFKRIIIISSLITFSLSSTLASREGAVLVLTCGVAGLGTKGQNFDIFVIGACSQQLPTLAPGNTVDGTFVMFVPLEAHRWLLDWTGPTEGKRIQI